MTSIANTDSTPSDDGWLLACHADIPNSRIESEATWPLRYRILTKEEASTKLLSLANAQSIVPDPAWGLQVDSVSFQPCTSYESQDRYAVRQLDVHGRAWSLTAIFDGLPFAISPILVV